MTLYVHGSPILCDFPAKYFSINLNYSMFNRGIAWVTESPSTKWTWLQSMFLTIIHDFLILMSVLDLDILSQESSSEDGLGPKFYENNVNFYIYLILFWLYTTLQCTVHIRKTNINVKVDDNFKIILEFPWRWRGFLAEDIQVQDNHMDQIFMIHGYKNQM